MTTNTCCGTQNGHEVKSHCDTSVITYRPTIDVVETAEDFRIIAEMPGVTPESLDVQFEKGELTIVGHVERPAKRAGFHRYEFGRGDLRRVLSIREGIDANGIEANLKNGLLTIRLPKSADVRAKKIRVES